MKYFLTFVSTFLIPLSVFAISWGNGTPGAYSNNNTLLDALQVKGASCFFKSNSDFLLFMQRYELNQGDYPGMLDAVNSALENLQGLIQNYSELKSIAEQTPYNADVLKKLSAYNYTNAQIVKPYLLDGNITGAYGETLLKAKDLLNRLSTVRQELEKGTSPEVTVLWEINQRYNDLMFFGQNQAQVFKSIK